MRAGSASISSSSTAASTPSDVARSPAWQKLLILDLPWAKRYERIIWLDADIVINVSAPNILNSAGPVEKVGICEDAGRLSPAEAQVYLECKNNLTLSPNNVNLSWRAAMRAIYTLNETPPHDTMFNTGVMVLSPAHHNDTLRDVYACPELSHLYEQPQLSHRLVENDLAHGLSPRFNWGLVELVETIFNSGMAGGETPQFMAQVMHVLVRSQLKSAYFLHFYGAHVAFDPLRRQCARRAGAASGRGGIGAAQRRLRDAPARLVALAA